MRCRWGGPGDDIVGARLDCGIEHRVLVGDLAIEDDQADPVEQERHGAGFRERPAGLGEIGATMVTANVGEFRRVRGLAVENWLV